MTALDCWVTKTEDPKLVDLVDESRADKYRFLARRAEAAAHELLAELDKAGIDYGEHGEFYITVGYRNEKAVAETEAVHRWFELSYAQYLTIARSVLQSMPDAWQTKFVALLEQLDERMDWRPKEGRYWVSLKDDKGRFVRDPLMDYERGRRRIPEKTP